MVMIRKFTEKEILEIVSKYACKSLPEKSDGTVEAQFNSNFEIEVFFVDKETNNIN
jgi:hypothetical protein